MNLAEQLARTVQLYPDKPAIIVKTPNQADQVITYRDLYRQAGSFSVELSERGVKPGEIVVLVLEHGCELIYAYYGVILLGAIPSILPFLTEKLLPERYEADFCSLISITRPGCLLTYQDFKTSLRPEILQDHPGLKILLASELLSQNTDRSLDLTHTYRHSDDIAILQHSSGTTGLQKGVALSHQSVLNQLESLKKALKVTEEDVVVSWLPLYHDMGLIAGFLMPVLLGITLVLMSPFDWVRAPVKLLRAVNDYQGTLTWLPNFAYNFCTQKIRDRELTDLNLSSWRAVINCSEPMRWESHQAFLAKFQPYGLNPQALATSYAMAENVFAVTQGGISESLTVEKISRDALQTQNQAIPAQGMEEYIYMLSAGRPIENVSVKVLDQQHTPLPQRNIGEIAIKSNCMLTGYYNRPELTDQTFHDGWFLTGDLGYIVNGEVFITGRKKDILIVGGKNIYPQDLELLAMQVPGVHPGRVSAFGVFNEFSGTEDVVIVAEVDQKDLSIREAIGDQIRASITRGSAVTLRDVYLVDRHWLIKTSSGKTARLANRDKYLQEINPAQHR